MRRCLTSTLQNASPDYMLTLLQRGADILVNLKQLDAALASALQQEAERRAESRGFFGFIAFAGLIARRPRA